MTPRRFYLFLRGGDPFERTTFEIMKVTIASFGWCVKRLLFDTSETYDAREAMRTNSVAIATKKPISRPTSTTASSLSWRPRWSNSPII